MPKQAFTDRFVAHVKVATRTTYFDTHTRGLALRITPAGVKSWAFVYRVRPAPTQWLAIGAYPAIKLADARIAARGHRNALDLEGRDPVAERQAARAAAAAPPPTVFTFADLVALYKTFAKGRKKTWRDDVQKIDRYLLPAWATRELRAITRADVHALLDTVAGRGLTVGVNRLQAVISRLFTIALDRSLIDAHPAARMIKRFAEKPRDRVLNDDELKALWTGLANHPGAAAEVVRLRLLLGQRGAEVAGMQWAELDLEAGQWTLPGSRTKNGRPHVVALPPTARARLVRLQADAGEAPAGAVFPGFTLRVDAHRDLAALHGGRYQWTDLRRTVATRLAGLGFDETTIGRTLNHARYTVTAKHYNQHAYLDEARRALEAWDVELAAIVGGRPRRSARVLRHRPRRPA